MHPVHENDVGSFYALLAKVEPYITKQDILLRQSICAEPRLEATLKILGLWVFIYSSAILYENIEAELVAHYTRNMSSHMYSSQRRLLKGEWLVKAPVHIKRI